MVVARYTKGFLLLSKSKKRSFFRVSWVAKVSGLALCATNLAKVRLTCTGTSPERSIYYFEGNRFDYSGREAYIDARGTRIRVGPTVYRALGNDSKREVVYMILGAVPPKNFPLGGRTLLGDGIPNRKKVPRWKK